MRAIKPYREIIDEMLVLGANSYRDTALMAAAYGHLDIVRFMLRRGRDVIPRIALNDMMATAAANGHINVVKLLISSGANNYKWTLEMAIKSRNRDIVDLLLKLGLVTTNDVAQIATYEGWDTLVHEMATFQY